MQAPVNCRNIADLSNGDAELIINAAIRAAVNDLDVRAKEDHKPRQAVITLTFELMDNDQIAVHCDATTKIPPRRTGATVTNLAVLKDKGPTLLFQTMDAKDPTQRTIDEMDDGRHG